MTFTGMSPVLIHFSVLNRRAGWGYSLIELMVVVAIVALLLMLALPAYQEQRRVAHRALGAAALWQIRLRQEQYFTENQRFASELSELGLRFDPLAIDAKGLGVRADSPHRIYRIALYLTPEGFEVRAHPQLTQYPDRRCGTLTLSSLGIQSASGAGTTTRCW